MAKDKIEISFVIGNLNEEHGGAQQLLFNICHNLPPSEFNSRVYYLFGEGTFQKRFEENGIEVFEISASSNYDFLAFARLVRELRKRQPDLLQTNSPISGVWGRVAATFVHDLKVISVEHSVHAGYAGLSCIANGLSLPLADAIVGVSDAVVESLRWWERRIISSDTEIRTIQNGVNINEIEKEFSKTGEVVSQTPISKENLIIGTVGRFTEAKGYKYLIRAFPEIKKNYSDAQLLLIGGGELMADLKSEAEETGYQDDIVFTGLLPNVFPYLPAFDVAVFPSLWEGLPLAPVESMVAKRPVVGTDIPPFREVIGDAGVLVEPENESELATTITSLIEHPERRRELGQKGYERAIENFSVERTVREYVDLYRSLVNE